MTNIFAAAAQVQAVDPEELTAQKFTLRLRRLLIQADNTAADETLCNADDYIALRGALPVLRRLLTDRPETLTRDATIWRLLSAVPNRSPPRPT